MSVIESAHGPRLGWEMAKRFAIGGVLIVVLSATAVASAILLEVQQDVAVFVHQSTPIPGVKNVLDGVSEGAGQTILLLGSDRRYADIKAKAPARSDTIILIRLDPAKHATAIMSIPRDLKVSIPGYAPAKINAAYALGGPKLTVRTVRGLLGIAINHVVNVNFGGFARAVNHLGCVYSDIDRRYFNDNAGTGEHYATIDLKAGYQLLCGHDALDYVRFRHQDSDFVRAARQQDLLRQAKAQIGLGRLFGDRQGLLRIFGRYSQTDIAQSNAAAILRLLKLAYDASKTPITTIHFPETDTPDGYVQISPQLLKLTVQRFTGVRASTPARASVTKPKTIKPRMSGLAPGLVVRKNEGETQVIDIAATLTDLPVYFPAARLASAGYAHDSPARAYRIADRNHRAYRIVLAQGQSGQYYGVQGTTWKTPPILQNPTDTVRMRHRIYQRYFDAHKLRLIAWKTPRAVYWVSNTLSLTLTNRQMMDIARSLQRIGQ